MIVIADSGSTKTHWCVADGQFILREIFTRGINPFYQTEAEISDEIEFGLLPELGEIQVDAVYFYGAGCSFTEKKEMVRLGLAPHFPNAIIEIESDLLGAARALFQHENGIACILGTGSNSCFYNGIEIVQNVSPLGFILGDEGSGAVLGKLLIADCLKNQLPESLSNQLLAEYDLTPSAILDNIYKMPFPNRFLAQFTTFILKHIEEPSIFNLVYDSFDAFFIRNLMQYPLENKKVGFVGSVAYYFRDTLEIVASERGIVISKIVQNPMEGLVYYHSK
jgi:N-acetylglucosamine kinase-like BadF-type ATPase